MKRYLFLIAAVTIAIIAFVLLVTPELAIFSVTMADVETVSPAESISSAEGVFWTDDYFTVDYIDGSTIGIGEPRYYQKNLSYLIVGSKRALLFDTGPGQENIAELVGSLTNLPITVVLSHLHYDHVGGYSQFDSRAMLDLPELREQIDNHGRFQPTAMQNLGAFEGFEFKPVTITEWLLPGHFIELGDRELQVIHIPGHAGESIALYDETNDYLFLGDHLYPGELLAFLPGADLGRYLSSTYRLLEVVTDETLLLPGHGGTNEFSKARELLRLSDLTDLKSTLEKIATGEASTEGLLPAYRVNERITLLTHFSWRQNFDSLKD